MPAADEETSPRLITAGPREGKSVWLLGARYTFKVTGKQTKGSYGTVEAECFPGNAAPPHIHHREDESFYILEGEMSFICGDRPFQARTGSFIHVPRGMLHSFKNASDSLARMLVTYSPAGFEQFFERAGHAVEPGADPPPSTPEQDLQRVFDAAPEFNLEFRIPPH
jgi:mannose-6-phosphate isomerase-like protein (cupin superfamily)